MITIPFNLAGFSFNRFYQNDSKLLISANATSREAACPICQTLSNRVHSYYTRRPKDLPVTDKAVRLLLAVRRFRCVNPVCPRHVFVKGKRVLAHFA
ncbi:MAG: transposase family protein [Chloroflexi bacterium]|uniref:Transposase family protein n=1 Tax=Candidatus Chlorohelix allophototropha TaxID=3003348 RepID=A0A8T7M3U1_9CHLR|nr:transposase family protein [Chloroflexota bacterium]